MAVMLLIVIVSLFLFPYCHIKSKIDSSLDNKSKSSIVQEYIFHVFHESTKNRFADTYTLNNGFS